MTKLFQFHFQGQPIKAIQFAFAAFFVKQGFFQFLCLRLDRHGQERPVRYLLFPTFRIRNSELPQQGCGAALAQPEYNLVRIGSVGMRSVMHLHQPADHGPIFVALRFLGQDEIFHGQHFHAQLWSSSTVVRLPKRSANGGTPRSLAMTSNRIRSVSR